MQLNLDEQQSKIVFSSDIGAKIVIAGAGSGKTRVAVETIVQKAKKGMDSSKLMMLTFSRKSELEMRNRLKERMEVEYLTNNVVVNTYHGFGWSLLRENPEAYGLTAKVTVLDEKDAKKLMTESIKDAEITFAKSFVSTMYEKLSHEGLLRPRFKNNAIAFIFKKITESSNDELAGVDANQVYHAIEIYQNKKRKSDYVDYEDLLLLPVIGLESNEELKKEIQERFLFIIADEAQDTNEIQYDLIRLCMPFSKMDRAGIMLVGDDDQSIYVWRGAKPANLHAFIDEYKAELFPLERNYRCNKHIVERAVQLISNNYSRLPKTPYSNKEGNLPVCYNFKNTFDMGNYVSTAIRDLMGKGVKPKDIAILYRNNIMSTFIEPMLVSEDIPYQIYKGSDFTKRLEIQIALSVIKLIINDKDYYAFDKLTKLMPGVGVSAVAQAHNYSLESGLGLFESAAFKWKESLRDYAVNWMNKLNELKHNSPVILGGWLLKKEGGGLYDYLLGEVSKSSDLNKSNIKLNRQIEHLKMLMDTIYRRVDINKPVEEQWIDALEVMLHSPDDEQEELGVTLSTIHKSKGLEFKYVFIFGLNAEFFEGRKKSTEDEDEGSDNIEESRRLAYVAMTRAEDVLIVCSASMMTLGKIERKLTPSLFLYESGLKVSRNNINLKKSFFDGIENKDILSALGVE